MPHKYYIYGLRAKGTEEIRYVGCTSDPETRLDFHRNLRDSTHQTGGNQRFTDWVQGNEIEMRIIEKVTGRRNGRHAEEKWIRAYRAMGVDLLNKRAGLRAIMTRQERVRFLSRWLDKHE